MSTAERSTAELSTAELSTAELSTAAPRTAAPRTAAPRTAEPSTAPPSTTPRTAEPSTAPRTTEPSTAPPGTTPPSAVLGAPGRATSVEDALLSRRSCRAFLPTPVPRAEIERLLALAARSASNSNSQPWQVHVVTGAAKQRLTADLLLAHARGTDRARELDYQPPADGWPEPFRSRRRQFGESLYGDILGIAAGDAEGRVRHHRRNYDFFGAPVGMIVAAARGPLLGALVDIGLFLQSLMLAARAAGLDTCAQAAFSDFCPVLRRHLAIPDDHAIVCGLALGYADLSHPTSRHRTPREPVTAFATFYSTARSHAAVTASDAGRSNSAPS